MSTAAAPLTHAKTSTESRSVEVPESRPLNVMFVITSMVVGGAETLLVNLIRKLDKNRCKAQVACLKERGELGEILKDEIPVHENLLRSKFDFAVLGRLKRIMFEEQIDAVITVGAGDKMFWGRLAAHRAKVPVVLSALHSTGWPDGVGRMNRWLTGITDGFIAVAKPHGDFLVEFERFPANKVHVIPNGIDTDKFIFDAGKRKQWRHRLGIPDDAPVCGIVAALRPEKDHELFLNIAKDVYEQLPSSHFVIVGTGSEEEKLLSIRDRLSFCDNVHFAGNTHDVSGVLSAFDLFALTSKNEASPVSILEAMSCGLSVVAPDVGSIDQAVLHGTTGFLFTAGDRKCAGDYWLRLMQEQALRDDFSIAARNHVVQYGSLESMTDGYMELVEMIYREKEKTRRKS